MICRIKKRGNTFVAQKRVFFCFLSVFESSSLEEVHYFLEVIHNLRFDLETKTYRPLIWEFEG